jgi:tetrahydromethanopterin S-methyltransferase subunit G
MDLETRMALVEQSYQQLDKRLEKVEEKLDVLSEQMQTGQHTLTKVIIGAAGTVTAGLLSTIVVLLMQV